MKWEKARARLIKTLRKQGIKNEDVLNAMSHLPRQLFVSSEFEKAAYENQPLPIGQGQTISQPYIVAQMTELLLSGGSVNKVLEIGTGSGYQAALLSLLVNEVYSVERIESIYYHTKQLLENLHYSNIHLKYGDGREGWPEHAPYDGIIVTAGALELPDALLEQLAEGGRLVIPVGERTFQTLKVITRKNNQFESQEFEPVIFVPLLPGKE